MAASAPQRRRRMIGRKRQVEDEAEDAPDALDLDDDSATEGSLISDDADADGDSDTSNIDEASPTSANVVKKHSGARNGNAKKGAARHAAANPAPSDVPAAGKPTADTEMMLRGVGNGNNDAPVQEVDFDDVASTTTAPASSNAPVIVSSSSAIRQGEPLGDKRRKEHEEYKKKRDEDPAFVPNRGAFFMHDHRHNGPAGNGFRPFGRPQRGGGGSRGGGRGGFGAAFAPVPMRPQADPLISGQWAHDMHETVAEPPMRYQPHPRPWEHDTVPNGNGMIPTCPEPATPVIRSMSTEKTMGKIAVRVSLPGMKEPRTFPAITIKQYTKLPDHRPPLRRDKAVRISLPCAQPRLIFPATDRSFIFIPRAMRPNQQRTRGKPRSGLGSVGGFSRRTSVFGGSYYGSAYSPSVAMSRRSSIAQDHRELFSPTGSVISRQGMPMDINRPVPVVRLPPSRQEGYMHGSEGYGLQEPSITDFPPPQTHPLPQKPTFQENRPASLPMHQPRPQKTVSVADIESPALQQNSQNFQQAFHQQVPVHVSSGLVENHARHQSYQSNPSTGTPLSSIRERAVHAQPFQPSHNPYSQDNFAYQQYPVMPPQQQFYYAPAPYAGTPSAAAPTFVPSGQPAQGSQSYNSQASHEPSGTQGDQGNSLVAQEMNGMVYYYPATQMPAYSGYPAPPNFAPGVMGMGGVAPGQEGFYYHQATPGMVYYSQ